MIILGISAFYHDSGAALVFDGEITAAAQEERFTRKKHDKSFPVNAVKFCLEQNKMTLDDVDIIVFYDKPLLKFERLLETYYVFAPAGLISFLSAIPVWIKEKLFMKKLMRDELSKIGNLNPEKTEILFSDHHLSHAASAFFPSPYREAAILTLDGVGEWTTASIAHGKDNRVKTLRHLNFPHSLGLLYSAFTYYLGFKVNSGEYKLMGLSPYGNPESPGIKEYIDLIYKNLADVKEDGSLWLNQEYFGYCTGLKMINEKKWEALFGFPTRKSSDELLQHHCDLALAIQKVTEEIILKMAKTAKDLTKAKYLCLSGGVALNCVANGKVLRSGIFEDIWIQPAAGDAGGALGAALAIYYQYLNNSRTPDNKTDSMKGSYLGPAFDDESIKIACSRFDAKYQYYQDFNELCSTVADLLDKGMVVGWFQGRMEWGPRALGNRTILGDTRNEEMQKKLNLKIKYRESFRPFAPSVIMEDVEEYFNTDKPSPYMILIADVKDSRRNAVPENYNSLPVKEKLYFVRSDMPAITHIDYSARLQTVHKETNPRYHRLISAFKEKTGYGVIVNTSFNVRGEPIVCNPDDAYRCFMRTEMDYLVMGNCLLDKKMQPHWQEKKKWEEDFVLD